MISISKLDENVLQSPSQLEIWPNYKQQKSWMLSPMYRRKIQKDKVTSDALMRQKPPKLSRGTNQEVLYFHLSIATKSGFLITVFSSKQPILPEIMLESFLRAAHISNESTRPLNTRKRSYHYAHFCQQDSGSNSTPTDQCGIDRQQP